MTLDVVLGIVSLAEPLGVHVTSMGARLVGHVPHVAPEAYLHIVFPPLSEADMTALEGELRRPLPVAYRTLLGVTNGLTLFSGSLSIYGRRTSYVRTGDEARQPFSVVTPNAYERPSNLPADAIIVGGYYEDGSRVYVSASGETVRCDRDDATPLNRWPDLLTMVTEEAQRLMSYFDESGRVRDGGDGTAPLPALGEERHS